MARESPVGGGPVSGGPIVFARPEIAAYYGLRFPGYSLRGEQWRFPCPIHNGEELNFAVTAEKGGWYCHSKCGRGGDILSLEMELTGTTFPEAKAEVFRIVGRAEEPPFRGGKTGQGSSGGWRKTEYLYTDEAGDPVSRVIRRERGEGADREKTFHQEAWTGNGWSKKVTGTRRVPYRLAKVLAAETVFLVEGEKDVETLEALGLVATCNPGGSGSTGLYAQWTGTFAGKHLIILSDNDQPGRKHAAGVAGALMGEAGSVRVPELPGLAEKGDVTDWMAAGGTVETLRELAAKAEPIGPEQLAALRAQWRLDTNSGSTAAESPKSPFRVTEHGVFWLKPDGEGGVDPVQLSAWLEIVADTRDASGDSWGRLLRWKDRDGKLHEWAMPMETLATDAGSVRARLMDGGLPTITTKAGLRDKFIEYLQGYPVAPRLRCVRRIGWYGNNFVLPGFIAGASEELVYQSSAGGSHQWNMRGSLEEWRAEIGLKCSGNSRLLLAASCGFAGPLLALAGAESGGVHLFGGTSTGKSTALFIGASVCGGGGSGFVQSWRSTLNGLEAIAEGHNDATLFLDELAQVDAKEAADTAYMLGNGQGKNRMSKGIAARERLTWRLLFVSSGEITLADHAAAAGRRTKGGVEVRLLNVEADAGTGMGLFEDLHGAASPDRFSEELKIAARQFFGSAFRAFLVRLVQSTQEAGAVLREVRENAKARWVPAGAAGEVARAADRFAIIGAAGELATSWKITGWQPNEAVAAAEKCFLSWLRRRGTAGASDMREAIRQVRGFIEAHGASRFQSIHEDDVEPGRTINRAGFTRKDGPETQYLILSGPFKDEVCKGFDHNAVARELAARGFLRFEAGRTTVKPRLPGLGTVRVYCVRDTIMQFDDSGNS